MKKLRISAIVLIFQIVVSALGFAESDFSFTAEPFAGFHSGVQDEFVYTSKYSGEKKLSELNWDQNRLFVYGARVYLIGKKIQFFGGLGAAAGTECGIVRDSDWLNAANHNDPELDKIKTNYSESDSNLQKYINANFGMAVNFDLNSKNKISPFAMIDYYHTEFYAQDLAYQYAQCDSNGIYGSYENAEKKFVTGKFLSLERLEYLTWLGLIYKLNATDRLTVNFSGAICPYAYVSSLDIHETSSKYFLDEMEGFFCGARGMIGLEYEITRRFVLTLRAQGFVLTSDRGTTKIKIGKNGNYSDSNGGSGFGLEMGEIQLGVKTKIF